VAGQRLPSEEKAKAAAAAPKTKPKADPDALFALARRAEQCEL
jgi:hypothetical protein